MNTFDAILIGFLQGITEWLPISSTGQGMFVLINFLGFSPREAFSMIIWMHLGTLVAVCVKFFTLLVNLLKTFPKTVRKIAAKERLSEIEMVCQFLIYSTFFSFLIGFLVYLTLIKILPVLGGDITTALIGISLIITGLILKKSKQSQPREKAQASILDSAVAGISQGLSIIPGISRSGIVLASLLWRKFKPEEALELCFLMAIPVTIAALIGEIATAGIDHTGFHLSHLIVGNLTSFLTGFLVIDLLLRWSRRINFGNFCIFIGLLSVIPLIAGVF